MRLSFGLETRQVQVQKLAPRMIQSMEILQLPIMALQERIEQELNENPVLELAEDETAVPEEEQTEVVNPDAPAESEKELEDDERKHDAIANIADRPESLNDYLLHQLGEMELESDLEKMCERIISSLDA